jgi:hypothetical protein
MVQFYDDDGEEIKPVSYKDFMSQGKDRMDKWLLKNEPTNNEEKAMRDALVAQKTATFNRQRREYESLTVNTRTQPDISNVMSNSQLDSLL